MGLTSQEEDYYGGGGGLAQKNGLLEGNIGPLPKKIAVGIAAVAIIAVIIIIFLLNSGSGGEINQNVEVTLLSQEGTPVEGAIISIMQECTETKESAIKTNKQGKAQFAACAEFVSLQISKQGFTSTTVTLTMPGDAEKTITLYKPAVVEIIAKVSVVDDEGAVIPNAKLSYQCISSQGAQNREVQTGLANNYQPTSGFTVDINGACTQIKLTASAQGFVQKVVELTASEKTKTITLQSETAKGTAIFSATGPSGEAVNAQITIVDYLGATSTIYTGAGGQTTQELEEGSYTFTAYASGGYKTGSFEITANNITDIEIYFTQIVFPNDNSKQIYLKAMDANTVINPVEARVLLLRGNDTNYFTTIQSQIDGKMGPIPVADTNGKTFKAVIRAAQYKSKLIDVQLVDSNASPQIIQMEQGGRTIYVNVIDDQNRPIRNAVAHIKTADLNTDYYVPQYTDSNGNTAFRDLANGNYKISIESPEQTGATTVTLNGSDQNITITVVLSTGTIKFNFFSEEGVVSPSYTLLKKNVDSFLAINYADAVLGTFTAPLQKVGTVLRVDVNDSEYFPYEGMSFTVKRESQTKNIYLRTIRSLPNQNPVQLLYRKAFTSDPISTTGTPAGTLIKGKKYYFLFDLVLNNADTGAGTASFYFEPNDENSKFRILSAQSIGETYYQMSNKKQGFVIDTNIVDTNAVQLNLTAENQAGPKAIPIVIETYFDNNAQGLYRLYWHAQFAGRESLLSSKEFGEGAIVCSENCPVIAFSSRLNWEGRGFRAIDSSSIEVLQAGDDYTLGVTAENTTDRDLGQARVVLSLPTELNAVTFTGGQKTVLSDVRNLGPQTRLPELTAAVIPVSSSSAITTLVEKVAAPLADNDLLAALNGNNKALRFTVKSKNELSIQINATGVNNIINEKSLYPSMYIKTKSLVKTPTSPNGTLTNVSAAWSAVLESTGQQIAFGHTDTNGEQLIRFDARNILSGDRVIFTSIDENGSIPARLEITVTKAVQQAQTEEECLSVKIKGVDVNTMPYPYIDINLGQKAVITLQSTCTQNRAITINASKLDATGLTVQGGLNFTILPGTPELPSQLSIVIDANDAVAGNNGLLGAYPVAILTKKGATDVPLANVDIIVNDSTGTFYLNKAIFDLRTKQLESARITNTKFSGRKDAYTPFMEIDNPQVYLEYRKNGIPETLDLNLVIDTVGVEAATYGYALATSISQKTTAYNSTGCTSVTSTTSAPTTFMFNDNIYGQNAHPYQQLCTDVADRFYHPNYPTRQSENWNGRDEKKAFSMLTAAEQSEVLASQVAQQAELLGEEKEAHAAFSLGNIPITTHPPSNPVAGDIYETFPNVIGVNGPVNGSCEVKYNLPFVDLLQSDLPSGFDTSRWYSFIEDGNGRLKVLTASRSPSIVSFGYSQGTIFGNLKTSPSAAISFTRASISVQHELMRIVTIENEKIAKNSLTASFSPQEGKVNQVGYVTGIMTPQWTGASQKLFGHGMGDSEKWVGPGGKVLMQNLCAIQYGKFIPFELATKDGVLYNAPEIRNPIAVYNSNGTFSRINLSESRIPQGVRVFLKNEGFTVKAYAEYIGPFHTDAFGNVVLEAPQVNSPNIDFNITRSGELEEGYSIITVRDWVSGSQKEEKRFRVKLIGSEAGCFSPEGDEGVSGNAFNPKLLYNWDWGAIAKNQCDYSNTAASYCDATQFTVTLFKKLNDIDQAIKKGQLALLPGLTNYSVYLMKDAYSSDFLNDFDDYYSKPLLSTEFNSIESTPSFDKLISEEKLFIQYRDAQGTTHELASLPSAGRYRVEIDVNQENENTPGIMTASGLNASVTVTFVLESTATEYKPLYELPLDGRVGLTENGYERQGYGTSFNGEQIKLDSNYSLPVGDDLSQALRKVGVYYSRKIEELNRKVVFDYRANTGALNYYPSQPNPLAINITSETIQPSISGGYSYEPGSFDASTKIIKDWTALGSSIGDDCRDFTNNKLHNMTETLGSSTTRNFSWQNPTRTGTVTLGTVILTPNTAGAGLVMLRPQNFPSSSFVSADDSKLKNGSAVMLKYYDVLNKTGYDTFGGMISMVKQGQMCITKSSQNTIKIWWNPKYLQQLVDALPINNKCY